MSDIYAQAVAASADVIIREFEHADHDAAHELWKTAEGVCHCDICTQLNMKERIGKFLLRNPGCSFVAVCDGVVVGTILAGHDGRTGMIYRLAVSECSRKRGIGKRLVEASVKALKREELMVVNAFVLNENANANAFWDKIGFKVSGRAVTRKCMI